MGRRMADEIATARWDRRKAWALRFQGFAGTAIAAAIVTSYVLSLTSGWERERLWEITMPGSLTALATYALIYVFGRGTSLRHDARELIAVARRIKPLPAARVMTRHDRS